MFKYECTTHPMDDYDQGLLDKLKRLRQETNWEVKRERDRLSRKLYPLIENWVNKLPDLREIFQQEEIDWLLLADMKKLVKNGEHYINTFVDFVSRTGYKDVPGVDEDGKPLLRRTTPIHYAARRLCRQNVIDKLFEMYDSDANYTDESGFSHLHAACLKKKVRIVESFIKHGQDPNLVWPETDDTPLLLALYSDDYNLAETLLRLGANPNLANAEGLTPLHVITRGRVKMNEWPRLLFELSDDKYHPLQVDAQDEFGRTPLHTAVLYNRGEIAELLLIHGAEPNLPDENGSTPLHVFCKINYQRTVDSMMECFFKACDETQTMVLIDCLDNQGRTPLQLAVANLLPNTIDILLDRGADLTSFVFPTERQFGTKLKMPKFYRDFNDTLIRASGAMMVVERLEKRGYELKRSDALIIMNYLARCKLMEKSVNFIQCLRRDHTFWRETSRIMIPPTQRGEYSYSSPDYNPSSVYAYSNTWPPPEFDDDLSLSGDYWHPPGLRVGPYFVQPPVPDNDRQRTKLSLHDLISLQPKELMNRLTYSDFFELAQKTSYTGLSDAQNKALAVHLSEKLSRGFFRRWALDPLMELMRLPLICCDIIIEQLINKDLYHICCAAVGQSSHVQ